MNFNTGTAHLVEITRFLLNDPATAANNQFSDQEIKDAINFAYMDVTSIITAASPGYFVKSSFADTVALQEYYAYPSDFSKAIEIVIEYDGLNIDTDTTAEPTLLNQTTYSNLDRHQRAGTDDIYLWAPSHAGHFSIYPRVATGDAGTKSIKFVFEYEPAYLSADGDAPDFPAQHHHILPVKAASFLLLSRNLPVGDLMTREAVLTGALISTVTTRTVQSDQFPSSAFDSVYHPMSNQGVAS